MITNLTSLLMRRERGDNVSKELVIDTLRRLKCTHTVKNDDRNLIDITMANNGYMFTSAHNTGDVFNEIKIWQLIGTNSHLSSTKQTNNLICSVAICEYKNKPIPVTVSSRPRDDRFDFIIETYGSVFNVPDFTVSIKIPDADYGSINENICISANGESGIISSGDEIMPWGFFILDFIRGNLVDSFKTITVIKYAISSKGNFAVFLDARGSMVIWSRATKQRQSVQHKKLESPRCIDVSDDGNIVVSGYSECINAWDKSRDLYLTIPCHTPPSCLTISYSNNILVSGHEDGSIRVWSFDFFGQSYDCLFPSPEHASAAISGDHHSKVTKISIADNMTILSLNEFGAYKIWQAG